MSKDEMPDFDTVLESCLALIGEQGLSLDDCLARFPQNREELRRLLPVAIRLREGRSLTASDSLRTSLAVRLQGMSAAQNENSSGIVVTYLAALRSIFRNRNSIPQRRALMIPALVTFLIVTVISMGGLVAGADAAGPGDLLFGLDTAIEDARLSFTDDEQKETELHIEFATERLEELKIEIEGEANPQDIEQALAAIQALLDELPPEQQAALEEALAVLLAVAPDFDEFEFEFEVEDGKGELELELKSEDDLDDDDLGDDDLDDDDEDDCDSSGSGSGDCPDDDDEDDDECDSSGSGSGDCPDDDDEDEHECDSSGSGSGDCLDDGDDDDDDDDNDEDDD